MHARVAEDRDIFLSYTKADLETARWIAHTLEDGGYTVYFQDWDFQAGTDFVRNMIEARRHTQHTVVVLSRSYLKSEMAVAEFTAAWSKDPLGKRRRVIPVRIDDCDPGRLWPQLTYIDLPSQPTREAQGPYLLEQIAGKRRKPPARPAMKNYAQLAFDQPLNGGDDELFSVAFSRQRRWIAAGSNGKVLLWDRAHLDQPKELEGPTSYVYSVAFSHDCRYLASGCEDHIVRVWDLASGELLWKAAPGREPRQRHEDAVYSVAFSPDGRQVVSGGYDRRVNLWNTASGEWLLDGGRALDGMGRVTSVAFAPGGAHIAIGSLDNKVRLWNPKDGGVVVLGEHHSSVEAVAFAPDGTRLASCGLDKTVRVWDVAAGKQLWSRNEHEYLVRSVAFSPDGGTVASASWDKTLRLWDATTGQQLRILPFADELPWHSDWIWSVAFEPEGTMLATGGSDGQVLLWLVSSPGP